MGSSGEIHRLHCHGAAQLSSEAHERALSAAESTALNVHLTLCPPCRHYHEQIDLVHVALTSDEAGTATEGLPGLPEEKREMIRKCLNAEIAGGEPQEG